MEGRDGRSGEQEIGAMMNIYKYGYHIIWSSVYITVRSMNTIYCAHACQDACILYIADVLYRPNILYIHCIIDM